MGGVGDLAFIVCISCGRSGSRYFDFYWKGETPGRHVTLSLIFLWLLKRNFFLRLLKRRGSMGRTRMAEARPLVPRYVVVVHFEDRVFHLEYPTSDNISVLYEHMKRKLGFDVLLRQTYKNRKKTTLLRPGDTLEYGLHGDSVHAERVAPAVGGAAAGAAVIAAEGGKDKAAVKAAVAAEAGKDKAAADNEHFEKMMQYEPDLQEQVASLGCMEQALVDPSPAQLQAEDTFWREGYEDKDAGVGSSTGKRACKKEASKTAKKAKKAKQADPPADDKGKQAKEPDPPPDKDKEAKKPEPKRRAPPAWAPRGAPGGWFVSQSPPFDKDGNKIEVKYTDVYWHQGM
jgi:hypothetical protein